MELTHPNLTTTGPRVRAWTLTWLWEPEPGSGERIAALLSLAPHEASTTLLAPATHVLLPRDRLSALIGRSRAESAHGILRAAAEFMTQRLVTGAAIAECAPPFRGFHQGPHRQALGFNTDQLIDAAVRTAGAFGLPDEIAEDLVEETNHSTETTRAFLARVQTAMAPHDDERRRRFNKRVQLGSATMTIDYAHQRHLVQFATAPLTERQQQNMIREAKAKLFEANAVGQGLMEGNARHTLVVNTSTLWTADGAARALAQRTIVEFGELARLATATAVEASSHEEAAQVLVALT